MRLIVVLLKVSLPYFFLPKKELLKVPLLVTYTFECTTNCHIVEEQAHTKAVKKPKYCIINVLKCSTLHFAHFKCIGFANGI